MPDADPIIRDEDAEADLEAANDARKDLPKFREGEAIDITGGVESSEYVRRGRDGDTPSAETQAASVSFGNHPKVSGGKP